MKIKTYYLACDNRSFWIVAHDAAGDRWVSRGFDRPSVDRKLAALAAENPGAERLRDRLDPT